MSHLRPSILQSVCLFTLVSSGSQCQSLFDYRPFHQAPPRNLATAYVITGRHVPGSHPSYSPHSCSLSLVPLYLLFLCPDLFLASLFLLPSLSVPSCSPFLCLYHFPRSPILLPFPINFLYTKSVMWCGCPGAQLGMGPLNRHLLQTEASLLRPEGCTDVWGNANSLGVTLIPCPFSSIIGAGFLLWAVICLATSALP